MEITFVLGYPTRTRGGIENAALAFAKGLASRGHTIDAIFNHDGELLPEYRSFCRQVLVLNRATSFAKLVGWVVRTAWRGGSRVYGHQAKNILAMWLLARLTRSKLVSHVHLPPPETRSLGMRIGLRGTDRFIFVSASTLDLWSQHMAVNRAVATVVRNGVDTHRFAPTPDHAASKRAFGLEDGCRVIAFVGRLDRLKGVHVLLESFKAVLTRCPQFPVRLLIAGSAVIDGDEYIQELRRLAAGLGAGTVRFVGRVQDPVALYQAADVVVIPSVWPDPQPLVTTESLACGVPVVASRIGGIPEILDPVFPDFLVEAGDSSQLADRIVDLIDWRQQSPTLGARCRQLAVSEFGLERCIERIETALMTADDAAYREHRSA